MQGETRVKRALCDLLRTHFAPMGEWVAEHPGAVAGSEFVVVTFAMIATVIAFAILVMRRGASREHHPHRSRRVLVVFVALLAFTSTEVTLLFFGRPTLATGGVEDSVSLIEGDVRHGSALRKVSVSPYPGLIGMRLLERIDAKGFKAAPAIDDCVSPLFQQEGMILAIVAGERSVGNVGARATGSGIRLTGVTPGSEFRDGDIATAANGTPVEFAADYLAISEVTSLTVNGKTITVTSENLPRCATPASEANITGTTLRPRRNRRAMGNSVSLVTALSVVDIKQKHWPTLRRPVVVTGAIRQNGSVVAIGGAGLKALSANAVHACAFVVPKENVADAQASASMPIIGVSTLAEAIAEIDALVKSGRCL
jgi:membrane-associated protease RseP (regulator of RpoE activity)